MKRDGRAALTFLFPWLLGFGALTLLPMVASLGLSLSTSDSGLTLANPQWVGLTNYREALRPKDPMVFRSLTNSLSYTVMSVALGVGAALVVAALLSRPMRGESVFRAIVYLPHLLGGMATLMIWSWLFNPQFGWINLVLRGVYRVLDWPVRAITESSTANWPVPDWLYSPFWCKPAVASLQLWTFGGLTLIFLVGLRRVPRELHEASIVEGAGPWRRFTHVSWPALTPLVLFAIVLSTIFAMQSFTESYVLSNRRQKDALLFYAVHVYRSAFEPPYRLQYACALSWILFAVLAGLIAILFLTSRAWVHYEWRRTDTI